MVCWCSANEVGALAFAAHRGIVVAEAFNLAAPAIIAGRLLLLFVNQVFHDQSMYQRYQAQT